MTPSTNPLENNSDVHKLDYLVHIVLKKPQETSCADEKQLLLSNSSER